MAEAGKKLIYSIDDVKMNATLSGRSVSKKLGSDYDYKISVGTEPFFRDYENVSDRLVAVITDWDMDTVRGSGNGDDVINFIRDNNSNIPIFVLSAKPLSERGDVNLRGSIYLETRGGKYTPELGDEMARVISKGLLKGKGLGTNSYNINSVDGRVIKYNDIREQILNKYQRRGLNTAFNQTIGELNQYRNYGGRLIKGGMDRTNPPDESGSIREPPTALNPDEEQGESLESVIGSNPEIQAYVNEVKDFVDNQLESIRENMLDEELERVNVVYIRQAFRDMRDQIASILGRLEQYKERYNNEFLNSYLDDVSTYVSKKMSLITQMISVGNKPYNVRMKLMEKLGLNPT